MLPETVGKQFDIFQAEKIHSSVQLEVTHKSNLAGLIVIKRHTKSQIAIALIYNC